MKRIIFIAVMMGLSFCCPAAWAVEVDVDANGAVDVARGGTNATTASGARSALLLGTAATVNTGTGATDAILGSDDRLTDARTPVAHNQAWDTITNVPVALNNVSGTNTGDQTSVSGTAGGLAAQYIDWSASTGGASIANKPTIPTNTNQLTNGAGFVTDTLPAIVANGVNLAVGDICQLTATGAVLADADAQATAEGLLLIVPVAITGDGATHTLLTRGPVTGLTGLTAHATYFINTTPGPATATAPAGVGDIDRVVGYALSTTELYFAPDNTYIER